MSQAVGKAPYALKTNGVICEGVYCYVLYGGVGMRHWDESVALLGN